MCKSYAFIMRSYMYSDVQSCHMYLSVNMICLDNCLQSNPIFFVCMITCGKAYSQFFRGSVCVGGGRGDAGEVPHSRICHCKHRVKTNKQTNKQNTAQIHSYIHKRLKFISFQCALDVSVISGGIFSKIRKKSSMHRDEMHFSFHL